MQTSQAPGTKTNGGHVVRSSRTAWVNEIHRARLAEIFDAHRAQLLGQHA